MMKYILAIVIFMAAIAGFLLYIGDASQLALTSTSPRDFLNFDLVLSWKIVTVITTLGLIGLIALWSFIGFLFRLPGRLKSGMGLRRRNQALDAMEDALLAGAEGDAGRSRKKAERARALVGSEALGRIVSAQAAEACGDSEEAMTHYRAMLEDEKTAATGRRGLAQQLVNSGDLSGAIELASTAYEEDKNARWAFDVLFKAQVEDYRWIDAAHTIARGERRKHIDKATAARRTAVLMTAEADRLTDLGQDNETALEHAVTAANTSLDFAPATALAARLLTQSGNVKKAISLIEKAWGQRPHPALAIAFSDTLAGETDKNKMKRFKALAKTNPEHRETAFLLAEQALLHENGVEAWSALRPFVDEATPSARVCQLAYQAETMLNNPTDARPWLERAATAPADADWSDLDPEGDAFDYKDQDWRRLVYTFGETGELIHPRLESGSVRRSLTRQDKREKPHEVHEETRRIDDLPSDDFKSDVLKADEDNLAERLDSLLGESDKPTS